MKREVEIQFPAWFFVNWLLQNQHSRVSQLQPEKYLFFGFISVVRGHLSDGLWIRSNHCILWYGAVQVLSVRVLSSRDVYYFEVLFCSHWKDILDWFSREIAHYGKTLISVVQQFSASIKKILGLEGRLGTRL